MNIFHVYLGFANIQNIAISKNTQYHRMDLTKTVNVWMDKWMNLLEGKNASKSTAVNLLCVITVNLHHYETNK